MALFPMFVELEGKPCLVVGGGEVALRKVEILLSFDAEVLIVAPEICSSIASLENKGLIKIKKSKYTQPDLSGASLVVAATSSKTVNEMVYRDAIKRNIPVNVVDDPEKCTFIFPSVVKRGSLTIGISTSGVYPALSKKIRKITEEMFPENYSEIVELLANFRKRVRKSNLDRTERENELGSVLEEFYSKGAITPIALQNILEEHEDRFKIQE